MEYVDQTTKGVCFASLTQLCVEHQFHDFDEKEELTSNNTGMVVGVRVDKRTTKGLGQMMSSSRQKKNTYPRVESTHVSISEQGGQ